MIVELQTGSVSRRDSFTVATSFTVQVLPVGARTRVVGSIETVTFQPERPAEQSDSLAIFPFAFRGHVGSNGALVLDSAAGQPLTTFTNCGIAGLNRISSVQRVLMTLPSTVTAGQAWTDSSTVAACSGTVPVQLTTVRTYRVIGETRVASGSVLTVERTDRIRAAGEGAQGQHRLTLRAEGSGSAQMSLDPGTGLILQVDGKQRTELAVGASGRVERFVQSVEERTRLN